jgi:hypothetical protein
MVQFKQKQEKLHSISHPDISDEILEHHGDQIASLEKDDRFYSRLTA